MSSTRGRKTFPGAWLRCVLGATLGALGVVGAQAATPAVDVIVHAIPTPGSEPYIVIVGPDGGIWFSQSGAGKVGRLDAGTGAIDEFVLPTPNARPIGITFGGDGALWIAENAAGRIARLARDGSIAEFACPTPGAGPDGMYTDAKGEVWFSERLIDRVAHVSPQGRITEYGDGISPGAHPLSITSRDGAIWFSEADGNRLGTLRAGRVTEMPLRDGTQPRAMITHPDGSLWFVATSAHALVRVDRSNHVKEFPVPDAKASLRALAVDRAGRIWFTEDIVNRIGVMSAAGRLLAEYPLPQTLDGLRGIAVTARGRVYFAATKSGAIGELRPR